MSSAMKNRNQEDQVIGGKYICAVDAQTINTGSFCWGIGQWHYFAHTALCDDLRLSVLGNIDDTPAS